MLYDVRHRTVYRYSQPVSISHHVLHLMPRRSDRQSVHAAELAVSPAPSLRTDTEDYFGNPVNYLTLQEQHDELAIEARARVEVSPPPDPAPSGTLAWDEVFERLERTATRESLGVLQFAFDSPFVHPTADVAAYARESFPPGRPVLEAALDLTSRIFRDFRYESGATSVSTPIDEVFRSRRGVCQDFAHLELGCLRSLALPARYVSGYLLTRPPPGQPKRIGADASHAWVSVWCPEAGWVDLDPTNDAIAGAEHVTLAWGRDYGDISPINGVIFGGGEHSIDVAVDVIPTDAAVDEGPITE
jgi:transglutaminase-like putative cysteine protease